MKKRTENLSNMTVPQLFLELRTIDADFLSTVTEDEMVSAFRRSESARLAVFTLLKNGFVLFSMSAVLVCFVGPSFTPHTPDFYWDPKGRPFWIFIALIIAFCMSGIFYVLISAIADWSGIDKAAWLARQLRIVSRNSSVRTKCKELVEKYPECAQYQLITLMRGRELRLVDLGVMVYLSNSGQVLRNKVSS